MGLYIAIYTVVMFFALTNQGNDLAKVEKLAKERQKQIEVMKEEQAKCELNKLIAELKVAEKRAEKSMVEFDKVKAEIEETEVMPTLEKDCVYECKDLSKECQRWFLKEFEKLPSGPAIIPLGVDVKCNEK